VSDASGGMARASPARGSPSNRSSFRDPGMLVGSPVAANEKAHDRDKKLHARKAIQSAPRTRAKFMSEPCNLEEHKDKFNLHPFTVSDVTPLRKVHFMFSVMGLHHAFVTKGGGLVGVLTKMALAKDDL